MNNRGNLDAHSSRRSALSASSTTEAAAMIRRALPTPATAFSCARATPSSPAGGILGVAPAAAAKRSRCRSRRIRTARRSSVPSLEEFVIDNATTMIAPLTYPAAATGQVPGEPHRACADTTIRPSRSRPLAGNTSTRSLSGCCPPGHRSHRAGCTSSPTLRGIRSSRAWGSLPSVMSPHFCATRTATRRNAQPIGWEH